MTLEKRQAPTDRFFPGCEVELVVLAVTIFDRMLEFVERSGLCVEELSIAVEKPVVDDTVHTAPLPLVGGPNRPPGPSTLTAKSPRDQGRSDPPPRQAWMASATVNRRS